MTADTIAGPLPRSTAPTVAGIAAASATIVGLSIRAGRQRTAAFVVRLCDAGLDPQRRHHRSGGGQAHPFERHPAQPQHAGPDAFEAVATADGDEPARGVLGRDRQRIGLRTRRGAGPGRGAPNPAAGHRSPPGGGTGRRRTPARRPGPTPRPRPVRPTTRPGAGPPRARGAPARVPAPARAARRDGGGGGGSGRRRAAVPRRGEAGGGAEAVERLGEVGDDHVALVAGERAGRVEVPGHVDDQPVEHAQGRLLVGVQARHILVCAASVGDRPDRRF